MEKSKGKSWRAMRRLARLFFLFLGAAGSAAATTVAPPEFGALVNGSDYVVHAITRNVNAEKRTGARGVKIVTRVELEVIEVVAGTPPEKIILEMLGGRVGDEELRVEGAPRFRVGDEDILFVSGNGRTICPLYGMTYGRYPISSDPATGRRVVLRNDGEPLRDTAQIAAPFSEQHPGNSPTARTTTTAALSPTEFIRLIRASREPAGQANGEK